MSEFLKVIELLIGCGSLITISFLILLSIPNCQLRQFLMPIVGWAMTIFCGVYVVSPVDVVPEALLGPPALIDDLVAIVTGIAAARMATKSKQD